MNILKQMILAAPFRISITWFFDFSEMLARAILPWVIARAIDGLINQSLTAFVWFVVIELAIMIIGAFNRYLDTRVYSKIIKNFSVAYYDKKIKENADISTMNKRLDYIDDLSGVLEIDIPNVMMVITSIGVSLFYLYKTHSLFILLFSVIVSCFVVFISYIGKRKNLIIEKINRNLAENEYNIIGYRNTKKYKKYVCEILKNNVKISDRDSLYFLIVSVLQMILLAIVLYCTATSTESILIGTLFGTITYIIDLNVYVCEIPEYIEKYLLLKDSVNRLNK